MAVELTLAIKPNAVNLDSELETLKAAVLYADKISILSPSMDVYSVLNVKSKNKKNIEIDIINKLLKAVPICEFVSKDDLTEEHGQLLELQRVSKTAGYRSSSLVERLKIQSILKESQKGTIDDLVEIFGMDKMDEFNKLDNVKVETFKSIITDSKDFYNEYMEKLEKDIDKNIILTDEEIGKEYLELPVFTKMSFEEVLKLREELSKEIHNFNKSLENLKKEMETKARKHTEYKFKDLYEEILKPSYEELISKLKEKELESDKKLTMSTAKKGEIIDKFNNGLMKEIIDKSAKVEETEYEKYKAEKGNEKAEILFVIK